MLLCDVKHHTILNTEKKLFELLSSLQHAMSSMCAWLFDSVRSDICSSAGSRSSRERKGERILVPCGHQAVLYHHSRLFTSSQLTVPSLRSFLLFSCSRLTFSLCRIFTESKKETVLAGLSSGANVPASLCVWRLQYSRMCFVSRPTPLSLPATHCPPVPHSDNNTKNNNNLNYENHAKHFPRFQVRPLSLSPSFALAFSLFTFSCCHFQEVYCALLGSDVSVFLFFGGFFSFCSCLRCCSVHILYSSSVCADWCIHWADRYLNEHMSTYPQSNWALQWALYLTWDCCRVLHTARLRLC